MTPSALSNERLTEMRVALTAPNVGAAVLTGNDLRDTISAITELQSYRSEGVAVKPLEWEEDGTSVWRAKTIIGDYMAFDQLVRASVVLPARWFSPGNIPTDAETIEDAKAAAQLDYATRIKSALSPSTERAETIEGWQPIETAPKDGTHLLVKFVGTLSPPTVAHWFGPPDIGGWYLSVQQLEGPAIHPTHWMKVYQ